MGQNWMKFVEMRIGDILSNRAEGTGALPAGWEDVLEAGLPGSPTGRARPRAARVCLTGARGGPGGRRQSALPGC